MKSLPYLSVVLLVAGFATPQGEPGEFAIKFRAALKQDAPEELKRLVKRYPEDAVQYAHGVCMQVMKGTDEELETISDALRTAWKEAYSTNFFDNIYGYYSLMQLEPQQRATWMKAMAAYDAVARKYVNAIKATPGSPEFLTYAGELRKMGDTFTELGDVFMAGTSYLQAGTAYDEGCAGSHADFAKAAECYQLGLPAYEKVELKNAFFNSCSDRLPVLQSVGRRRGVGPAEEAPATPGSPGSPSGGGAAVSGVKLGTPADVALTFELVPEIGAIVRPVYANDDNYALWMQVGLQEAGTTARFPAMSEFKPVLMRTGSSKLFVDQEADGVPDVEVPLKGKIEPVQFSMPAAQGPRAWGFLAVTGMETDTYQNIEINLAPADERLNLFVSAAASMVGEIGGTRIQIIDENMDGLFGEQVSTWKHTGLVDGSMQTEVDSVLVGAEKAARPWSEFQLIGTQWYRFASKDGGQAVTVTPAELERGTLRLSYTGGVPEWLVVRGEGPYAGTYFELVAGGAKGLEVPVGKYELFAGLLSKGKRKQESKALMLPGKSMEKWVVKAGEVTTIELGAPFGFDFKYDTTSEHLTVRGKSVCVTGSAGERYERLWNCVPRPDVSLRKAGDKKGSRPEAMPAILDQDTLITQGFESAWFPFDLVLENQPDEKLEVQLSEKKNKLFGVVTSDWK